MRVRYLEPDGELQPTINFIFSKENDPHLEADEDPFNENITFCIRERDEAVITDLHTLEEMPDVGLGMFYII